MHGITLTALLLLAGTAALGNITEDDPISDHYQASCRAPLGMQSGEIPDSALSASSEYDKKSVGVLNSRIRTERNGGAWCPKVQVTKDIYEYLQIDLGKIKVVTHVETQGRFGNGQGMEFAPHYLVEYQREDGGRWIRFRNVQGNEIMPGNANTYLEVTRALRPPIIARRIRIVPYSVHPRTICMRIELMGCDWEEGVTSYSMRQGDRRGQEVDLYDFTYDGQVRDGYLSGGLGQLLDWETGQTNFRLDTHGVGKKGYEWVGWKNDSLNGKPAEIRFEFDGVYNFSAIRIHTNNMFGKDIMVFSKVVVYFSIGGRYYSGSPVVFEYMRDELIEFPRHVTIPIPHRIGRYVKLEMYFAKRWIMISEIRFENELEEGNFTAESAPPPVPSTPLPPPGKQPHLVEVDILSKEKGFAKDTKGNLHPLTDSSNSPNSHENPAEKKNMDDTYIGVIIGALSALLVLLAIVVAVVIVRHRRNKYGGSNPLKMFVGSEHINFNLNDLSGTGVSVGTGEKVNNGNMYKGVAVEESQAEFEKFGSLQKYLNGSGVTQGHSEEAIQSRKLPELPKTPDSTDTSTYATPLVVQLPPHPIFQSPVSPTKDSSAPGSTTSSSPPPPPLPHHPDPWALCKALDSLSIQGLSGTSMYAVPEQVSGKVSSVTSSAVLDDLHLPDFPQQHLRHIDKLGEGEFGEVHLCEVASHLVGETGSSSMLVAVKTLRSSVSKQTRMDFMKEVKIMSRLRNGNIVRVLGVCRRGEPLSVVTEFMKYGDLHQFLLQHMPDTALNLPVDALTLSYGSLIYMATQIASGMKYIESQNMVHRDLASRNCLVGANYTIKISDFGMSRSLYSSDYYRIEGKAVLPIRWMAWESVLLGTFSPKSDVWSFGVTLWEILTFARDQPFEGLSDEAVIENCGHYYRQDAQQVLLPAPPLCPKEIFDLVCACWHRDHVARPTFQEIHMFLQRKNMGYNPCDEKQINSLPVA